MGYLTFLVIAMAIVVPATGLASEMSQAQSPVSDQNLLRRLSPPEPWKPDPQSAFEPQRSESFFAPNDSGDPYPIDYLGSSFWSYVQDAVVQGNYAFCNFIHGLLVLDISDPTTPTPVARLDIERGLRYRAFGLSGSYVYGTTNEADRFAVIDIFNPLQPTLLDTSCQLSGAMRYMDIAGDYVYLTGYYRFDIVDVSDPAHPVRVGGVPLTFIGEVEVAGDYAYIADYYTLKVFDVSDPTGPVVVDSIGGFWRSTSVSIAGNYLYMIDEANEGEDSIAIIDISNPLSVQRVGGFPVFVPSDVHASDSLLFVGLWNDGVQIYTRTNPVAPIAIGDYSIIYPSNLVADNGRLYISSSREQFTIVDISIPNTPLKLGSYTPAWQEVALIDVSGNRAAVGAGNLYLLDITDPVNTGVLGSYPISHDDAWAVKLLGDNVLVADGDDLNVVSFANPQLPVLLSQVPDPEDHWNYGIWLDGSILYGEQGAILSSYDMSSPSSPELLGSLDLGAGSEIDRLWFRGNYAYGVGNYLENWGLMIIDVSDPALPKLVAERDSLDYHWNTVEFFGDFGFVHSTASYNYIQTWDFSDPLNPTPAAEKVGVGSLGWPYVPTLIVRDGFLYTGNNNGLEIFDLFDPTRPVRIASHKTPSGAGAQIGEVGDVFLVTDVSGIAAFSAPLPEMLIGDADVNGMVNISDAVFLIGYIFVDGPSPLPRRVGDIDCSGFISITDVVYLLSYIFGGGPAPCK